MKPMQQWEIAWVAGLYEGEGSAVLMRRPSGRAYPKVSLHSSDEDVLLRAQGLTGLGHVLPYSRPKSKPHWKQMYAWQVTRSEDVIDLLEAMIPFLLSRRSQKAREVIAGYREQPPAIAHEDRTHCPAGHPYGSNTYISPKGARRCRVCSAAIARRYRQRKALVHVSSDDEG